jgi:VCBS repeat protein
VKSGLAMTRFFLYLAAAIALFSFLSVAAAFAGNPIPQVVGPPKPQAVVPGSGAFTLTVYGANFVSGAVVNWNRQARSTTFISARELQAQILAADVAAATAGYITVTNPPPGGGVSSSSYSLVEVHRPTKTIVAKRPNIYLRGIGAQLSVLSDFNNDGILDFATDYGFSQIKVLLGNGDGSFGHGSIASNNYYGSGPAAIASGDFNNDGYEDLVFGADPNGPPTQLQVNLGRGNGKFRQGKPFGQFDNTTVPLTIAVGDFNRDGNLDLAVAAFGSSIPVFLGRGDGTFKQPVDYGIAYGPYNIIAGDFNGDGKLDLLVDAFGLQMLLGNGDGTFQKARNIISLQKPINGLLISDLNGDGKLDLAFSIRESTNGKIGILLGNGDGTFKKAVYYLIKNGGIFGFSFTVGDFNSDGKTDLLVNYLVSDTQSETDLYLGKGDGTFQPKKVIKLPGLPNYNAENGFAIGDFNSDGLLDFISKAPGEFDVFVQK